MSLQRGNCARGCGQQTFAELLAAAFPFASNGDDVKD